MRVRGGGEKEPGAGLCAASGASREGRKEEKIKREQEERRWGERGGKGGRGGAFTRPAVVWVSRGGTRPSGGDIVTVVTAVPPPVPFALMWPWAWTISAGVRALWGLWLWLKAPQRSRCWAALKDREPGLGQTFSTQSLSLTLTLTPTFTPTLVLTFD